MDEAVAGVELVLNYIFNNKAILWEAIQAPGPHVSSTPARFITKEGNIRMALKGDAAASAVLLDLWYESGSQKGTAAATTSRYFEILNLLRQRKEIVFDSSTCPKQISSRFATLQVFTILSN